MSDPAADHLSAETIAALADGELTANDLAHASQHLAVCAACTTRALDESLLQRATARAGQRYVMPESLEARILQTITAQKDASARTEPARPHVDIFGRSSLWAGALAALLLVTASGLVAHDLALRSAHTSALVAEVVDEHIAAMAVSAPEVISTDRHTVKPWFQGKLPFSFNLPAALPADISLDGANLVQLNGQAAAQLLFSIGKHHASVFLRQRGEQSLIDDSIHRTAERNGFHVEGFRTLELDGVAVSDADPSRLHALALAMQQAQAGQ